MRWLLGVALQLWHGNQLSQPRKQEQRGEASEPVDTGDLSFCEMSARLRG